MTGRWLRRPANLVFQAIDWMFLFSRDLCRAALCLWMMLSPAIRSITGTACENAVSASALLPDSIARTTCLIRVRSRERRLALCLRRLSDCLDRFLAWEELAKCFAPAGRFNGARLCDFESVLSMASPKSSRYRAYNPPSRCFSDND